jgi:hypothetical protein
MAKGEIKVKSTKKTPKTMEDMALDLLVEARSKNINGKTKWTSNKKDWRKSK